MSSNTRLYGLLLAIAVLIMLIVTVTFEYRKVSGADWTKVSFELDSKEPYGTWLFQQMTKKIYKDAVHKEGLPTSTDEHALYIRIADKGSMSQESLDSVLQFVAEGNDALIIANTFAGGIDTAYSQQYYLYNVWEQKDLTLYIPQVGVDSFTCIAYNEELDTIRLGRYTKGFFEEYYEDSLVRAGEGLVSLYGTDGWAVIKVPYGEEGGHFYYSSTPQTWTNVSLQQPDMVAFYNRFMPLLATPAVVYWDDSPGQYIRNIHSDSPLKYILSEPALRLAYYLLLGLGVLFMLFRSRRRQQVIPLQTVHKNTSLDYIDTLAKLYHKGESHEKLVQHIEKIFYHNVEQTYYISKSHPDFVTALAKKSRQEEEDIEKLLVRFESARKGEACSTYQLQKMTDRIANILDTTTNKQNITT